MTPTMTVIIAWTWAALMLVLVYLTVARPLRRWRHARA
jgi:hypothetical protein